MVTSAQALCHCGKRFVVVKHGSGGLIESAITNANLSAAFRRHQRMEHDSDANEYDALREARKRAQQQPLGRKT